VPTAPEQIAAMVRRHAGDNSRIGIETGAMTPWLVHELRALGLEVICLDARHARAALKMQINKTDQTTRKGWLRSFAPAGSGRFTSSRRQPPRACASRREGSTRRHDDSIVQPHPRVLKTFGLLLGAMRGLRFDRKVEVLLEDRSDVAPIVRPMLVAWRHCASRFLLSIRQSGYW